MRNGVLQRIKTRAIAIFAMSTVVATMWLGEIAGFWTLPGVLAPNSGLGAAGIWVPIFAGQAYVMVSLHRLKRRLRAANGALCPTCGYDLRGMEATGACPECGTAYDPAILSKAWKGVGWR